MMCWNSGDFFIAKIFCEIIARLVHRSINGGGLEFVVLSCWMTRSIVARRLLSRLAAINRSAAIAK